VLLGVPEAYQVQAWNSESGKNSSAVAGNLKHPRPTLGVYGLGFLRSEL
jgi:hypothetical protein